MNQPYRYIALLEVNSSYRTKVIKFIQVIHLGHLCFQLLVAKEKRFCNFSYMPRQWSKFKKASALELSVPPHLRNRRLCAE